ncbi:hypothetical protein [Caballeronia sp. TF1N1]|nr:hypothetical protein [Caballeronia sp. TF1N1]
MIPFADEIDQQIEGRKHPRKQAIAKKITPPVGCIELAAALKIR